MGTDETITIEKYWRTPGNSLLLDARSPKEFAHAHIPGATNIPLLDDDQRSLIGTIYKNEGRRPAVLEGFRLAGPEFHIKVKKVLQILNDSEYSDTFVYCWRGGMRSDIIQWIMQLSGIPCKKITAGYKAYRRSVLDLFTTRFDLRVLGGKTGSGKTALLAEMAERGEQVIDLEKLANHKGSAFGGLGKDGQPSNEMFENLIYEELRKFDIEKPVWVENESRSIGKAMIPQHFFDQIRNAPVVEIDPGYDYRFKRIKDEYGGFSSDLLAESTKRIKKRLGPNNVKEALDKLNSGEFDEWLKIVLGYYDKLYDHSNSLRDPNSVQKIDINPYDTNESVDKIIKCS